jgi:mono/diheme cytochrome c family protein
MRAPIFPPCRGLSLAALTLTALAAADTNSVQAIQILQNNCGQCHTKALSISGLDLTTREAAIKGGSRGPAIVPGKAAASKLIEAVERKGKLAMPPAKTLSETEIGVLRNWIDRGATWPQSTTTQAPE